MVTRFTYLLTIIASFTLFSLRAMEEKISPPAPQERVMPERERIEPNSGQEPRSDTPREREDHRERSGSLHASSTLISPPHAPSNTAASITHSLKPPLE